MLISLSHKSNSTTEISSGFPRQSRLPRPDTPFSPDRQSWIRNGDLDPDWLRIGADIVGGNPAPAFNASFSLSGTVPDSSSTAGLLVVAFVGFLCCTRGGEKPMR